ncbi:MAG: TIGR00282 family metallophosphoesterase [Acidobacteria bacterium]|nr:MAG: TIGR00282 family metallophosphoesterase [Acidobacteriota bacterium]
MQDTVTILYIGDIFGRPGRSVLKERLPELLSQYAPDLVFANVENAAAGFGITPGLVDELLGLEIAVLTTGNHIWDKKEIYPYLVEHADGPLLRPANYPPQVPGRGLYLGKSRDGLEFAVINLQGRVFMPSIDCPFRTVDTLLESIPESVKIRFVDMHAEATSEKLAMGWYLDGRVTAVVGTHTHIPTADEMVLPGGTAYITDLGMTGPYESVIGIDKDIAIRKFLNQLPERFDVAKGDVRLCGVVVRADARTGRAVSIERVVRK